MRFDQADDSPWLTPGNLGRARSFVLEAATAIDAGRPASEPLAQDSIEFEILAESFPGVTSMVRAALRLADGRELAAIGCGGSCNVLDEGLAYLALANVLAATLPNIVDTVLDARKRTKSKTDLWLGPGPMVLLFREEVYLMHGASLLPGDIPDHVLELRPADGPTVADRNVDAAERRAARLEQIRSVSWTRSKSRHRVSWTDDDAPGVGGPSAPSTGPADRPSPREPRPPSRPRSSSRDGSRGRDPSRTRDRDRESTCVQRGQPVFNRVWSVADNRFNEVCRLWNMARGQEKCPRTPCQHQNTMYPVPRLHVCLFCLSPDHRRGDCPCERGEQERPRPPTHLESHDWDPVPRSQGARRR
jgi:hypothetical protein